MTAVEAEVCTSVKTNQLCAAAVATIPGGRKLNSKDNSLRREITVYSFACLMLVILGTVSAVPYKLNGDIEFLIFSLACLMSGLVVVLAGSLKKDLYDYMKENKA